MNTLEGLVLFLPSLWMFAVYWNDIVAAALGAIWIVGRIVYMTAYVRDPKSRSLGFLIQMVGMAVLLLGSLAGAIWSMVRTGAL
jgi:glutathione S-transferase